MLQSLLSSHRAPVGINGIISTECIKAAVCSIIPERSRFPVQIGFSLRRHRHLSQPAHTISWCLKAEAKATQGKSSSCELVAALCSMFDLWEWVTNEDTPHRQVSFHWPQGWIGARSLPCSSSFGKSKQLIPENSSFSVASFSNANTYFCLIWKAKEASLLASLQHFCLQAAFPSPMKSQDICLLLSNWAKKSK